LIKIKDIHVKTLIMLVLLSEQARGRPGTRGYHVGDPCSTPKKGVKMGLVD